MKILLDAQLPRSFVQLLREKGYDAIHTFDLPRGNRSSDATISAVADRDGRVVFSKDADFIQSQLLQGSPAQLLVVTTGNINNRELAALLIPLLPELAALFADHQLIELNRSALIIRR